MRARRSITNGIESSFSVVATLCRRVKRWQGSDHRLRWVASALLYAETRWNRLHGYCPLPLLLHNLQRAYQLRCNLNTVALAAHLAAQFVSQAVPSFNRNPDILGRGGGGDAAAFRVPRLKANATESCRQRKP